MTARPNPVRHKIFAFDRTPRKPCCAAGMSAHRRGHGWHEARTSHRERHHGLEVFRQARAAACAIARRCLPTGQGGQSPVALRPVHHLPGGQIASRRPRRNVPDPFTSKAFCPQTSLESSSACIDVPPARQNAANHAFSERHDLWAHRLAGYDKIKARGRAGGQAGGNASTAAPTIRTRIAPFRVGVLRP